MRPIPLLLAVALFAAACSDAGVSPTSPDGPDIQASHRDDGSGGVLPDLCSGLSPCDAFDYDRTGTGTPDGIVGEAGYCFVPPMTDNHNSDAACSAPFVGGLPDGTFQLEWCEVDYSGVSGPLDAPALETPRNCGGPLPLTWDGTSEFYQTSIKFSKGKGKNDPGDIGKTFRLYIVQGDHHRAHRDVIVDPNLTSPADANLLAVGTGNVPVKVRVTESVECDEGITDNNVENCLIVSDQQLYLGTLGTNIQFGAVVNPFFVSATLDGYCAHVTDPNGDPAVDLLLPGCKVSIDGDFQLDPSIGEDPGFIQICDDLSQFGDNYTRFAPQALGVLHVELDNSRPKGAGVSVLPFAATGACECPPDEPLCPESFTKGDSDGLFGRLASLLGIKPLVATSAAGPLRGGGGSFYSNTDFELAVLAINQIYDVANSANVDDAAELDLGVVAAGTAVPVAVQALALCDPLDADGANYCDPNVTDPQYTAPVEGQTVRYFALGGTVSCDGGAAAAWCSTTTDASGMAAASWTPGTGESELKAISCGAGIYGSNLQVNPALPEGSVQGPHGFCNFDPTEKDDGTAGPANGWLTGTDPFAGIAYGTAPSQVLYESGINDLPLTWKASSCPTPFVTDGVRGDEWQVGTCAGEYKFTAKTTGGKTVPDNASLLWTNDGTNLYVAIEIRGASAKDLNDAFFYFDNDADANSGTPGMSYPHLIHEGDDVVVMRLDDPTKVTADHYAPPSCDGSPKASLCSAVDATPGDQTDGAAGVDGNNLFWEFSKALADLSCPNGEDFCLGIPDFVGVSGTITGGQGGSKGGTEVPGDDGYILIEIK
jgi:hypothetical protein